MTFLAPILTSFAAVAALLAFMALVRQQAGQRGWSAEVQRKLVHIATGLFAICLPLIFRQDWPVYLLLLTTLIAMAAMRLPRFRSSGLGAALHSVGRQSWGDFLFAASVGLVFLISQRDMLLYVLPLAVLTLGDAAAALAGSNYGKRFFTVEDGVKSVEGSAILFLVTLILAMTCLLLLSSVARENVILLALLIAAFSTLVEADSWKGFDNLFLPLGVLVVLREHAQSPAADLVMLALLFLLAIVVFSILAGWMGLSRHVGRVYVVASFLVLSVTAVQNAVLPMGALVLHAVAERRHPANDRHPELDAVAAIALLGFGWLALGNATGLNALDFFGATFAGLCVALAAVAITMRPLPARILVAALCAVAVWPVWAWLMHLNPSWKHWAPDRTAMILGTLLLCGALPAVAPGLFARNRMARLAMLSAAAPVLAFVVLTLTHTGEAP